MQSAASGLTDQQLFRLWLGVTEYLFRKPALLEEVINTAIEDNTFRSDDLEFTFAARVSFCFCQPSLQSSITTAATISFPPWGSRSTFSFKPPARPCQQLTRSQFRDGLTVCHLAIFHHTEIDSNRPRPISPPGFPRLQG
jgi:hypothetical protein